MAKTAATVLVSAPRSDAIRATGRRTLLGRAIQPRGASFGFVVVVLVALIAASADLLAPFKPSQIQPVGVLAAPSHEYLLGTDAIGRDVLSRIIFGTRVSILAGAVSVGVALI